MKNTKIGKLLLGLGTVCIIALIVPFFLKPADKSWFDVWSLSLSVVSAVASVIALGFGVYLYDRFGANAKFNEKQIEKVFELIDALKGKTINATAIGYTYYIRLNVKQYNQIKQQVHYKINKDKKIAISPADYEFFMKPILLVGRSYWLPIQIKEKMQFLSLWAYLPPNQDLKDCVIFDFGSELIPNPTLPIPEMTFDEFNKKLYELVAEIETWIKEHSDIPIDFKFEESEN